jgi:alkylation response protein AidB-like acyl-CoA dehydrogenase
MQMEWNASQRAVHDDYRAIADRFARNRPVRRIEGFDWDLWHHLAAAGLWRMPLAEGADGWWNFTAAVEGLAQGIRSLGMLMSVANQASVIRGLMLFGGESQKSRHLGALLDGAVAATAISEPVTGTDVRAIETTLTREDGKYRLDGAKLNISHASTADLILVVAKLRESGKDNTALVLIGGDAPGVIRNGACDTLGNNDLPIGDLVFDKVAVVEEQLLGQPQHGLRNLMQIASLNRVYFALASAQVMAPFLAEALRHAQTRRALDVPLASHQYVQKRLVDIKIGLERTRWLSYAALGQLLAGHEEALMTCSIAKLVGAEHLVSGALDLLRLHGTAGYRKGAIATFVRDALGLVSAGGTEEMHRKNIFGQMERLLAPASPAPSQLRDEHGSAVAPAARRLALAEANGS